MAVVNTSRNSINCGGHDDDDGGGDDGGGGDGGGGDGGDKEMNS